MTNSTPTKETLSVHRLPFIAGFSLFTDTFRLILADYRKSFFIFFCLVAFSYFSQYQNVLFPEGSTLNLIFDFVNVFLSIIAFYVFFSIIAFGSGSVKKIFLIIFNYKIYVNLLIMLVLFLVSFRIGLSFIPSEITNHPDLQYIFEAVQGWLTANVGQESITANAGSENIFFRDDFLKFLANDKKIMDFLSLFNQDYIVNGIANALLIFLVLSMLVMFLFSFTFPYMGIYSEPKLFLAYRTSIMIQVKNILPLLFLSVLYTLFFYFIINLSKFFPFLDPVMSSLLPLFSVYMVYNVFISTTTYD